MMKFEDIIRGIFEPSLRTRIRFVVVLIFILGFGAGIFVYDGPYNTAANTINAWLDQKQYLGSLRLPNVTERPFRLGLDLQGGTHLVYQADLSSIPEPDHASAMQGVRDVIERRVNAFGVSEPDIRIAGSENDRLNIELAGISDVGEAIRLIGETPLLEFKEIATTTPAGQEEQELSEEEKEIRKRAEEVLAKALEPDADFDALAKEFSQDSGSAEAGGELGYFPRGVMVGEFENVLFDDLEVGEITKELVETQFGYHIIKKLDERINEEGEKEVSASHILIQNPFKAQKELEWQNTELSGKHLTDARVVTQSQTGEIQVSLSFNKEGEQLFEEITGRNVGKPVAIFLDGNPISIPTVQQQIIGGQAVITGSFSLTEAQELAQRLRAGALPVPISLLSQQTIGASLGQASVAASIQAGLWGLIAVMIFMIFYYRWPGVLAVIALAIYGAIVLAVFKLWPITLTLAGIAGFILSLGFAVDANILIFSRLKEELLLGKPKSSAIDDAFKRAWPAIRDGNVSTLITCFILVQFSTSLVKGFAITLAIGILISMFSAIVVTKKFLQLTSNWPLVSKPIFFSRGKV